MFLQGSLLLSVMVCLVTCLPQPLSKLNELPKDPSLGILRKIAALLGFGQGLNLPSINPMENLPLPNIDVGVQGATGNLGLPGVPAVKGELDLNQRISSLEAVLKLEGRIQEVGKKIIATNAKEVDFETSVSTCKAFGGHIATPMNDEENNAILAFVKKHNRYAYLGIKEGAVPNTFQYMNGSPAVYTHWGKNEPSNKSNEKCVEMYTDGTWNDKACNQNRLTVCEF